LITEAQLWAAAGTIVLVLFSALTAYHFQNRRDAEKEREAQKKRDIELTILLKLNPLHTHIEDRPGAPIDTPLLVGGVVTAKTTKGD
jgi:hypothetical protein